MGPTDSNAVPLSQHPPLRQLWQHADRHRPKVVLATIFSVLNTICDIAPELLYFDDRTSGCLMAVLNDDINQLERFLDVGANQMILTISNVVLAGLAFFIISPELALLAFLPIPVIVVGSLLYQKKLEPRYDAVRAAAGRIADTLTNNLGGIATIK